MPFEQCKQWRSACSYFMPLLCQDYSCYICYSIVEPNVRSITCLTLCWEEPCVTCIIGFTCGTSLHFSNVLSSSVGLSNMYNMNESWTARYNTWLLIELTPKGVVFSFSFLTWTNSVRCSFATFGLLHKSQHWISNWTVSPRWNHIWTVSAMS